MKEAKINTGDIRLCSLGQMKIEVEKQNERDEFLVFLGESLRDGKR